MMRHVLPFVASLAVAQVAVAQTSSVLMSDADWTLYGVDGYTFEMWGEVMQFDGICVAETLQDGNRLQFAVFFREWRAIEPALIGLVMGQAHLPGHAAGTDPGDLIIRSGTATYRVTGADHAADRVSFMVDGVHAPTSALHVVAVMGEASMTLEDDAGSVIAEFSAKGFETVLDALMDCGGVTAP